MKVSGSSPFIKWCYLLQLNSLKDSVSSCETSVCELCARAFLGTPLSLLFVAIIGALTAPFVLLDMGIKWIVRRYNINREVNFPVSVRVVSQRITDWRDRVCTKVEIE